jgi:hypothetical protein
MVYKIQLSFEIYIPLTTTEPNREEMLPIVWKARALGGVGNDVSMAMSIINHKSFTKIPEQ